MSWMSNFMTRVKPLLKPQFRGTKKKKKKSTTFMTSIGKDEEKTARSLLTSN
jgi:hypothetical protein